MLLIIRRLTTLLKSSFSNITTSIPNTSIIENDTMYGSVKLNVDCKKKKSIKWCDIVRKILGTYSFNIVNPNEVS